MITLELTSGVIATTCAVASVVFGAGLTIGDLRYYRRKEGTDLERVVAGLTEIVNRANEDRETIRRVHQRIDELSGGMNRILGWMEKARV